MWMEQDVLRRLAGECKNGVFSGSGYALAAITRNWWSQLKTAGAAIYANRHYLALRQRILQTELLQLSIHYGLREIEDYTIIGHVYVHPSARVHHTALVSTFFPQVLNNTTLVQCV